jgi:hypothetical protein
MASASTGKQAVLPFASIRSTQSSSAPGADDLVVGRAAFDPDVHAHLAVAIAETAIAHGSGGGVDLWALGEGFYVREGEGYSCLVPGCGWRGRNGSGKKDGASPAYTHGMARHAHLAPEPLLRRFVALDRALLVEALKRLEKAATSRAELVSYGASIVRAAVGGSGGPPSEASDAIARGRPFAVRAFARAIGRGVLGQGQAMNSGTGELVGSLAARPCSTACRSRSRRGRGRRRGRGCGRGCGRGRGRAGDCASRGLRCNVFAFLPPGAGGAGRLARTAASGR